MVRRGNGLKLRWYREEASESAPYVSRVVWTKTLTVRVRYPSQESSNKSGVFACVGSRSVSPDMNVASGGAWPRGLIIDDVNRLRDRPGILHLAIEISCR